MVVLYCTYTYMLSLKAAAATRHPPPAAAASLTDGRGYGLTFLASSSIHQFSSCEREISGWKTSPPSSFSRPCEFSRMRASISNFAAHRTFKDEGGKFTIEEVKSPAFYGILSCRKGEKCRLLQ